MIPDRFQEFYDPEPDYDRIDAARDCRLEQDRHRREYLRELVPEAFTTDREPDGELSLF